VVLPLPADIHLNRITGGDGDRRRRMAAESGGVPGVAEVSGARRPEEVEGRLRYPGGDGPGLCSAGEVERLDGRRGGGGGRPPPPRPPRAGGGGRTDAGKAPCRPVCPPCRICGRGPKQTPAPPAGARPAPRARGG